MSSLINISIKNQKNHGIPNISVEIWGTNKSGLSNSTNKYNEKIHSKSIVSNSHGNAQIRLDFNDFAYDVECRLFFKSELIYTVETNYKTLIGEGLQVTLQYLSDDERKINGTLSDNYYNTPLKKISLLIEDSEGHKITSDEIITGDTGEFQFMIADVFFLCKPKYKNLRISFYYNDVFLSSQPTHASQVLDKNFALSINALSNQSFEVNGRIVDSQQNPLYRYEVKLFLINNYMVTSSNTSSNLSAIALATTDAKGYYHINFQFRHIAIKNQHPKIYIKVYDNEDGAELAQSDEHTLVKTTGNTIDLVAKDVNLQANVRGIIVDEAHKPLSSHYVEAYYIREHEEALLGNKVLTDSDGRYSIDYTIAPSNYQEGNFTLVVKLKQRNNQLLMQSPLIFHAQLQEEVNMAYADACYQRPLFNIISEVLEQNMNDLYDLVEIDKHGIETLAYNQNIANTDISIMKKAIENEINGLDKEVMYGIFKQYPESSLLSIALQKPNDIRMIINQAIQLGYISKGKANNIEQMPNYLHHYAGIQIAQNSQTLFNRLLTAAQMNTVHKRQFITTFLGHEGSEDAFWKQANDTWGETKTTKVQTLLSLVDICRSNTQLILKIHSNLNHFQMVQMDTAAWQTFLKSPGISLNDIEGHSATEKRQNFALYIKNSIEKSYPTAALLAKINNDNTIKINNLDKFYDNNNIDFEQDKFSQNVDSYDYTGFNGSAKTTLIAHLKCIERLYAITPTVGRFDTFKILYTNNIHTALAVVTAGKAAFESKMQAQNMPLADIDTVFDKAEQLVMQANMALAHYTHDTHDALSPHLKFDSNKSTAANIFTHLDYCGCEHCQSVYGPAAYLADILQFIEEIKIPNRATLLSTLTARRPDISKLILNCQNTNTILPVIDLVNELLEDEIANNGDETHQTTKDSAALKAYPEHLNEQAYDTLKTSSYPWTAPFHLWNTETRAYLAYKNIDRSSMLRDVPYNKTKKSTAYHQAIDYAADYFGIDNVELIYDKQTASLKTVQELYGAKNTATLTQIQQLDKLLTYTGMDIDTLQDVLQSTYVNPMVLHNNSWRQKKIEYAIEDGQLVCDISRAHVPLNIGELIRLSCFRRLQLKTNWSTADLDKTIIAYGNGIDEGLIVRLYHIAQLHKQYHIDIAKINALLHPMDRLGHYNEETALYDKVFLNPALGNIPDDFKLLASSPSDIITSPEILAHIRAALAVSDSDLLSLITHAAGGTTFKCTLNNLSVLFRHTTICKMLHISMEEHLLLMKIMGDTDSPYTPFHSLSNLLYFIEETEKIKASQWTIYDLAYMLLGETHERSTLVVNDKEVAVFLEEARTEQRKIRDKYMLSPVIIQDLIGEVIDNSGLPNTTLSAICDIAIGESTLPYDKQKALIDQHKSRFDSSFKDKAVSVLVETAFENLGESQTTDLSTLHTADERIIELLDAPTKLDTHPKYDIFKDNLRLLLAMYIDEDIVIDQMMRYIETANVFQSNADLAFVRQHFGLFMDADKAIDRLFRTTNNDNSLKSKFNRILYINTAIVEALMEDYLYQKIADLFGMEALEIKTLSNKFLYDDRLKCAYLQAFKRYSFISSTAPIERNGKFSVQFFYFELMYKALLYIKVHQLSVADMEGIHSNFAENGWLQCTALPARPLAYTHQNLMQYVSYERWSHLENAINMSQRVFKQGVSIFTLINQKDSENTDATAWFEACANAAVWSIDGKDLRALAKACGYASYTNDFHNAHSFIAMEKVLGYANTLQSQAAQLIAINNSESTAKAATNIRRWIKASMSDGAWLQAAPKIRKPIREQQRQALSDYLLHKKDFANSDAMHAHFLIDTEISACAMSSRLKQASLSVQLFVQRFMMGLEEDDTSLSPSQQKEWEWSKQYRLWEANRKIFVQTENYLSPELRRNKTDLFDAAEKLLREDDITDKSVNRIYRQYLSGLSRVAHLEICDISANHAYIDYDSMGADSQNHYLSPGQHKSKRTHVLARSRTSPHTHYYRYLLNDIWSPWQLIDIEIGDKAVIVEFRGQVFVAWIEFNPVAKQQQYGEERTSPESYYELRLGWTQYDNGEWSAKHLSQESFDIKRAYYKNTPTPCWLNNKNLYGIVPLTPWSESCLQFKIYMDISFTSTDTQNLPSCSIPAATHVDEITYLCNFEFGSPYAKPKCRLHWLNTEKKLQELKTLQNGAYIIPKTLPKINVTTCPSTDCKTDLYTYQKGGNFQLRYPSALVSNLLSKYVPGNNPPHTDISEYKPAYYAQDPLLHQDEQRSYMFIPKHSAGAKANSSLIQKLIAQDVESTEPLLSSTHSAPTPLSTQSTHAAQSAHAAQSTNTFYNKSHSLALVDRQNNTISLSADKGCLLTDMQGNEAPDDFTMQYSPKAAGPSQLSFKIKHMFHPLAQQMLEAVNYGGINALLANDTPSSFNQNIEIDKINNKPIFGSDSDDTAIYKMEAVFEKPYPKDRLAFAPDDAYGLYNWELFFHIPMMIAERLSQHQRYAEAQQWYHYIFNPLTAEKTEMWICKPLQEIKDTDMFDHHDIKAWRQDPFNPHMVASMRPYVYRKHVFMKYLDNLLAWGDHLFARDSMESVNEATQIYLMAANLLGHKPQRLRQLQGEGHSYDSLGLTNDFSNAMVEFTDYYWDARWQLQDGVWHNNDSALPTPIGFVSRTFQSNYFGIPQNDKLLGYWDTLADRLFKLRHCMNIKGVERQLALFQPPIDPALIAKAMAGGLSISQALADLNAPLSHYRYRSLYAKAMELAQDVKSLGQSLLSALEKKDAEALATLRSQQEADLLDLSKEIKTIAIEEKEAQILALRYNEQMALAQQAYYTQLIENNLIEEESNQIAHIQTAHRLNAIAQGIEAVGAMLAPLPQVKVGFMGLRPTVSVEGGGMEFFNAAKAASSVLGFYANKHSHEATVSGIMATHRRREQEWAHQQQLAQQEQGRIQKQLLAADIHLAMAKAELQQHEKQMAHNESYQSFLKDKFTNEELYAWMVGQLSDVYFQSYRMAADLAKKAERSYRYETGDNSSQFVSYGHWNGMKKGLLAGEKLIYDLRRMDIAFIDRHKRQLELSKQVSLALVAPEALLQLRKEGKCVFDVPEILFDLDYPGMYRRRIKSVSISIPGVTGPYTNVSCQLCLLSSKYRNNAQLLEGKYAEQSDSSGSNAMNDERFVYANNASEYIATSSAQNDSGMFELNFHDERYLPFEGAGAISKWQIELPNTFRAFDYNSIADVILHINYTAHDDMSLKDAASSALLDRINEWMLPEGQVTASFIQMIDVQKEAPDAWHQLKTDGSSQLTLTAQHFPYFMQQYQIKASKALLYINGEISNGNGEILHNGAPFPNSMSIPNSIDLSYTDNTTSLEQMAILLLCEISQQ